MQNPKTVQRRSKVLIDRTFQLRFIGRFGGTLFFYLLLFLVISVVAPVAFTFVGNPPEWALMETAFRVEVLLRLILAPLLCTFLCLFAHGVLETFRIAGPNYRFKAVLRDLQQLRLPRGVEVRKGDYLRDTAEEFDQALVTLHDTVRDLHEQSRVAFGKVKCLGALVEDGAAAREALAAVARIEHELARFELVSKAPACMPAPAGVATAEPLREPAPVG